MENRNTAVNKFSKKCIAEWGGGGGGINVVYEMTT